MPVSGALGPLARSGKRAAFPRVVGVEILLFEVADFAELERGYRGILEPPMTAPRIEPFDVDVFVVPGLRFDPSGRRLGRGGGHYDRLLARARAGALCIGMCYADQIQDRLPAEDRDVPMSLVVSGRGVIRTGASRSES